MSSGNRLLNGSASSFSSSFCPPQHHYDLQQGTEQQQKQQKERSQLYMAPFSSGLCSSGVPKLVLASFIAATCLMLLGTLHASDVAGKNSKLKDMVKKGFSNPYAWVYMSNSDQTLLHVLVSSKSARLAGSTADVVVLWFGDELPSNCMRDALRHVGAKLRVVKQPIDREAVQNKQFVDIIDKQKKWWDWVKLLTFDLTEYQKVVFLDGDTLQLENIDSLFEQPYGTHTDAPKSPLNSGMFVVEPNHQDYQQILDIVYKADYDLNKSWGGSFVDNEGKYHRRSYAPFYGAESTQGLLYYWFHVVKKQYKLLSREKWHYQGSDDPEGGLVRPSLVHFNICEKPKPGVIPDRCQLLHKRWQKVYDELQLGCEI